LNSKASNCFGRIALLIASLWPAALPPPAAALEGCTPLVENERAHPDAQRFGQGLLWRVSRPGTPPSHVFGTMHVSDPRVTRLPPPVRTALEGSGSFVMEALLDAAGLAQFTLSLFSPGERTLEDHLGESLFARAAEILTRYGMPLEIANALEPWAAYATLSMPPPDAGLPLDVSLMELARRQGAALYGLESMQEQADALAGLPIEDQLRLLTDTVCHYDVLQQDIEVMIERYLKGDLDGLKSLSEKYMTDRDRLHDRVMEQLLFRRNARMAKRLAPRLLEGNAFVAVGALHLPGERGLLALIERQGFEIARVY
jgi:uncharacterized protein YbaP (TraB family)